MHSETALTNHLEGLSNRRLDGKMPGHGPRSGRQVRRNSEEDVSERPLSPGQFDQPGMQHALDHVDDRDGDGQGKAPRPGAAGVQPEDPVAQGVDGRCVWPLMIAA